jgi:hypothetical protein
MPGALTRGESEKEEAIRRNLQLSIILSSPKKAMGLEVSFILRAVAYLSLFLASAVDFC